MSIITVNRELFRTIYPLLRLSSFMGLCPVSYQTHGNFTTIRWSSETYIFGFFMAIILASWGLWGFITDIQLASFIILGFTGTIDVAISTSDVCDIIFSCFYFIVSSPMRFKSFATIMGNFHKMDSALPQMSMSKIRTKSIIFVIFWSFLPILYILDLFMWENFHWRGINSYSGYYLSYSIVVLHEFQYWLMVTMIRARILTLNYTIGKIFDDRTFWSFKPIIQYYNHLTDSIDTINQCFSISTSVMVLSCYVHLVTCPYQLYVMITSNETSFLNFVYLIWVSFQLFRLMLIVEVCHGCTKEGRKTKDFLVLMLTNDRFDKNLKNDVRNFLAVVIKKKIHFKSYGIPKIDRHILLSIAGSISAYWMILLQYS